MLELSVSQLRFGSSICLLCMCNRYMIYQVFTLYLSIICAPGLLFFLVIIVLIEFLFFLQVWPIEVNLKFLEPVGRELKQLGKVNSMFQISFPLGVGILE